jgi:kinetochore protein NDC80
MDQNIPSNNRRFEQLTLRANALREELHTEIEKMLNDIIRFKVHIQKNLEDYEGFVSDEVEKELGGNDEVLDDTQDVEMR